MRRTLFIILGIIVLIAAGYFASVGLGLIDDNDDDNDTDLFDDDDGITGEDGLAQGDGRMSNPFLIPSGATWYFRCPEGTKIKGKKLKDGRTASLTCEPVKKGKVKVIYKKTKDATPEPKPAPKKKVSKLKPFVRVEGPEFHTNKTK